MESNGELRFVVYSMEHLKAAFSAASRALTGDCFVLTLQREKEKRRNAQNRRYWAILHEIATDRETQTRRWEQQKQLWDDQADRWKEQSERWKEQNFRWAQEDRRWEELAADRKAQDERINQRFERLEGDLQQIKLSIGALGARWGLSAEESFRSALAGILTESYGVTVLNVSFQDSEGKVFGRPDQVEMDIVVTNGVCMAIEIKS